MAKKITLPTFAKKDEIPKGFESLYEERDGKWQAIEAEESDDAGDEEDEEEKQKPNKLQGALKKEREAREKAEKKTRELADRIKELEEAEQDRTDEVEGKKFGKTADEMKALRQKIRDDARKEFAEEIEGLQAKIKEFEPLASENRTLRLNDRVKAQMLAAGARGERVDDLFRLSEEEFDLDDDKNPILKNHPGKAMKVFLESDLKKRYPEFYKGTEAGGGGARGGQGGGGKGGPVSAEDILNNPGAALTAARAAGATK